MRQRQGFTLNELLIVIAIIALMTLLALPAFNALSGSRSLESAQNQVSAFLGQARTEAIGVQEPRGVMFFLDLETDRINMAQVRVVFHGNFNNNDIPLIDLVADHDFIALPVGVGLQTIDNPSYLLSGNANDHYIGYNDLSRTTPNNLQTVSGLTTARALVGGVILFDGYGKLAPIPYGFHLSQNATSIATTTTGPLTALAALLATGDVNQAGSGSGAKDFTYNTPDNPLIGGFGIVLYDRQAYAIPDPAQPAITGTAKNEDWQWQNPPSAAISGDELVRENWLRGNADHLLVNRFNGTLFKGQ